MDGLSRSVGATGIGKIIIVRLKLISIGFYREKLLPDESF